MSEAGRMGREAIVGRDEELRVVRDTLDRLERGSAGVVLEGEPGIGKTEIWEAGLELASERSYVVLRHRAAEVEADWAFAALGDVFGDSLDQVLAVLAPPRRRALAIALLLVEGGDAPPDGRALALAVLDGLRHLARRAPVVVAIDDVHWLDPSTASVLGYALRRAGTDRVGLFAAVRRPIAGSLPAPSDALLAQASTRLVVGPMTLGGLYQLLRTRIGLDLTRPEVSRLLELTGGNPLFALEVGRELVRTGWRLEPGRPVPVPGDVERLLARRLARLGAASRDVLTTAAALTRPSRDVLVDIHGAHVDAALVDATAEAVAWLDGDRVRFAHPLFASVLLDTLAPEERRAVHGRIAERVVDIEERARHLALAEGPGFAVAETLDAAAERALGRGATAAAADLSELAAGQTPSGDPLGARRRRRVAAEYHRLAGNRERAVLLLGNLRQTVPAGPERVDVLLALARTRTGDVPSGVALCVEALAEAGTDDARAAEILAFQAWLEQSAGDVGAALSHARAALARAEQLGDPSLLARVIARVGMEELWAQAISPGLLERGVELEKSLGAPLEFNERPSLTLARRMALDGRFAEAREIYRRTDESALARGDEGTHGRILFHLALLEWYAGEPDASDGVLRLAIDLADQLGDLQFRSTILHARSFVDAHLGLIDRARSAAVEGLALAEAQSDRLFEIAHQGVLGFLDLSRGDARAAANRLGPLPGRQLALGWREPAFNPVWPNAVEALVRVGELADARREVAAFEERATRSVSDWSRAVHRRAEGMLLAAEGDPVSAAAVLEDALAWHRRLDNPFDEARTLLWLGSVRRRAGRRRAAREALEASRSTFVRLGAGLWADRASGELARIGGRRPTGDALTPTQRQVAELARAGRSNKEIAAALGLTAHTVETHLTAVYRKLDIASRVELVHRLDAMGPVNPGGFPG